VGDGASSFGVSHTSAVLLEAAKAELGELGWNPEGSVVDDSLLGIYTTEQGSWSWVVVVYPDEPVVIVRSVVSDPVPSERIVEMAQYVARSNDGLPRANLELDIDSGIVSCKSYLDLDGVDVDTLSQQGFLRPLVQRVLLANFATLDIFFAGIAAVAEGRMSAAEADAALVD